MLKKFSVKNFKNFREEITIDFSDIGDYDFNTSLIKNSLLNNVLIYGKNAVGKSNLGLALFDITIHVVDKINLASSDYSNYINADNPNEPATFSYTFQFAEQVIEYTYQKLDKDTMYSECLTIDGTNIFDYNFQYENNSPIVQSNPELATLNWEFKDHSLSILKYIANNSNLSQESPIRLLINFISSMIWLSSPGPQATKIIGLLSKTSPVTTKLIEENRVPEFQTFLNQNGVPDKLVVKTDVTGEKAIYIDYKKPVKFIDAFSSGTASLTAIFYLSLYFEDASFVFIDEFDANYHFEVAENIVKLLQNKNFQSVLTSHNTNLMSNNIMRPDCYLILMKEGLTPFFRATERELREGHNLEKLYQSGEFENDR
ncbi:ATP-binding protein [Listeria weihenstephanensis]|uniref:ATP-binding protein n=1 Tax=Listeria weihenstephanensis TaxID=1006155 RepID=A0A841Z1A8_9LIST|nr:AAA family ATPase [Listeria weihenstephanensis]MBC1498995.1 ATP-binding protein [Listeria weihenstephanensis]